MESFLQQEIRSSNDIMCCPNENSNDKTWSRTHGGKRLICFSHQKSSNTNIRFLSDFSMNMHFCCFKFKVERKERNDLTQNIHAIAAMETRSHIDGNELCQIQQLMLAFSPIRS